MTTNRQSVERERNHSRGKTGASILTTTNNTKKAIVLLKIKSLRVTVSWDLSLNCSSKVALERLDAHPGWFRPKCLSVAPI